MAPEMLVLKDSNKKIIPLAPISSEKFSTQNKLTKKAIPANFLFFKRFSNSD